MPQLLNLTGRRFLVWGLGKTGIATAGYLSRQGAHVTVVERAPSSKHAQTLQILSGLPIQFYWGGSEPDSLDSFECILLSPGVPYDLPSLQHARTQGHTTIASLQWAASQLTQPMLAVTGTAGKSTTVSLLGQMLEASGLPSFVGGNLGFPLISLLEQDRDVQRVVVECSSFQLEACPHFVPHISVLTNISSNHLDRHKTMEAYTTCKAQQFNNLPPSSWAIIRANDPICKMLIQDTQAQVLTFSTTEELEKGAMIIDRKLLLRHPNWGEESYDLTHYKLPGAHNQENAMAAALAARLSGATPEGIQQALEQFNSLAHRLEAVTELDGVRYINDSKSTTPQSSSKAIAAFKQTKEPLHLLLGGRSKGSSFAELAELLPKTVKAIYLFGEAAEEIGQALQPYVSFTQDDQMEDALQRAKQMAKPGEIILLSPACASYDQFKNFEERGDAFKAWIQEQVRSNKKDSEHA